MVYFDAAVIGGGVLGCFAARNLRRWNISTVLIEAAEDVCSGITRANSAVVYAGYDNQPGSLKAKLTVSANASFSRLCEELDVPFVRRGSLMVASGPNGDRTLQKKLVQGMANGVPDLQLLTGAQARQREPALAEAVTSALYAPTTGTVNPWGLGIAAYENARYNGCEVLCNTRVQDIRREANRYILETDAGEISCKAVLNCAGLQADKLQELLFPPSVRLVPDAADYIVLDRHAASPRHILFQEREEKGKGITGIPTVEGNLLLEGLPRSMQGKPWATTQAGLDRLRKSAAEILPGLDIAQTIRTFAAVRPNAHGVVWRKGQWIPDGRSIGSFVIENPGPGFYSLIGIKTPGLTCANELGRYLGERTAGYLQAGRNPYFDPYRRAISRKSGNVVCLCQKITKGEMLEAISRGATSVEGIKRRTGAAMGCCQGGRCRIQMEALLKSQNPDFSPEGHFPLR